MTRGKRKVIHNPLASNVMIDEDGTVYVDERIWNIKRSKTHKRLYISKKE